MNNTTAFHSWIEPEDWEQTGPEDDPATRLLATIQINDLYMHLEAIEVSIVDGIQKSTHWEYEDIFENHFSNFGGDGRMQTTEINGRKYALFASPFCD